MTDSYIALDRTFHELSLKSGDSDEFDYQRLTFGKGLTWQDLTARWRSVILSEAGSGKTEEIRQAARSLRSGGEHAFFLRLEHVADDFEIAFEEGSLAEFKQWLSSQDEGWLFLDSVDEARLREPKDFETAVRKIALRISAALQRTHVVLTSRGSAWRPVTDLKLCQQHLRYLPPAKESNAITEGTGAAQEEAAPDKHANAFTIVALDDLSRSQVERFARVRGIADPEPFLDAIERADAWSMAARPDDLSELVAYWDKHQSIGNRLELMQASIARRLLERDQARDEAMPLSRDDAEQGARTVAAAATMAQEATIRVPDGTETTAGIAVSEVLPGWDSKKCAALLTRPIFDEAIYQTVRFHHRTVREYLTAEWLQSLLDRAASRRKVEALLFREQYGHEVIVPTMRPVLVWLILLDSKIRERALALSPELIFEGGEPKALPLETRRAILVEVCAKIDTDVTRGPTGDLRAIQRFADKDLVGDIKTLIAKYAANSQLQWFLQRMIWQGELVDALPEAKAAASNPKLDRYARIAAFRAVRAVGSPADMAAIRQSFLTEAATLNREWFAELLTGLPPTASSVDWVLACIGKLPPRERNRVDGLGRALEAFVQALGLEELPVLVTGLDGYIAKRPVVARRHCEISQRFGWLMKSAAQATERLVAGRHPAALETPTLSIIQKLPAAHYYREWDAREIRVDFASLVPAWPDLNHRLFWHDTAQARRYRNRKLKERVTQYWQVANFASYWLFTPEDFERLLADIALRPLRDDRLVALSAAFSLYVQSKRPKAWLRRLLSAVNTTPVLRAALDGHLHPAPPTDEQMDWRRENAKYRRSQRRREAAEARREEKFKAEVALNIAKLRGEGLKKPTDIFGFQYHLHERMRELDPQSNQWTVGNWQVLETEFGAEAAKAFRDGVVAYWRRYRPKLRSEGKAGNQTPFAVIFGLTGLNIEARETSDWASTLGDAEIDTAFRYAMDELNGFPDWLPELFALHPELLSCLLLREVDRDLRIETSKVESHYVLSDLSWSGQWAWPEIGAGIFARLQAREPKNMKNLGYMLNIVHGAQVPRLDLTRLAQTRSADRRLDHAARWFAVWTGIEPGTAIPALTQRLAAIRSPANQTRFAMLFVSYLLGGRRTDAVNDDAFRSPGHLKSLYALMHRYIREKEDIQRAGGGVYSPGLRDDAQDARNQLFALLKEIPGKEAYLALVELGHLHPEPSSRPWMQHHAKAKAQLDADSEPWSITQTLDFQGNLERTPRNHRELFEFAHLRLLDLKDNLEHGDSSIAGILVKGATLETDMRKYIGDWLRQSANGRFHIPQEEELADAKRIDLRIHGMGFDAPVPGELKLADKWTGPQLFERLENQLCGDYLRDTRSSRGLFVLVYRGEKQRWELPSTNQSVDFGGLLKALQARWSQISSAFPAIDDIAVVGIDLTVRNS